MAYSVKMRVDDIKEWAETASPEELADAIQKELAGPARKTALEALRREVKDDLDDLIDAMTSVAPSEPDEEEVEGELVEEEPAFVPTPDPQSAPPPAPEAPLAPKKVHALPPPPPVHLRGPRWARDREQPPATPAAPAPKAAPAPPPAPSSAQEGPRAARDRKIALERVVITRR